MYTCWTSDRHTPSRWVIVTCTTGFSWREAWKSPYLNKKICPVIGGGAWAPLVYASVLHSDAPCSLPTLRTPLLRHWFNGNVLVASQKQTERPGWLRCFPERGFSSATVPRRSVASSSEIRSPSVEHTTTIITIIIITIWAHQAGLWQRVFPRQILQQQLVHGMSHWAHTRDWQSYHHYHGRHPEDIKRNARNRAFPWLCKEEMRFLFTTPW